VTTTMQDVGRRNALGAIRTHDPRMRKTRPAVIVQDDILNRVGGTTIVAPITSNTGPPLHLTRVFVRAGEGGISVDSVAVARQLRAVDPRRLVRKLGTLRPHTMAQVNRALMVSLGCLVDL
jgi:mRNA interferase MazF